MADDRAASQTLKAVLGIRDVVFSGKIMPGERLSEVTLSEGLGLSRTPVRAALARLEQEGILEVIPSGGYSVRAFSQNDVIDAIELRGVLEGTAARLAAERGVAPTRLAAVKTILADLDKIVSAPLTEMDFQGYVRLNADFHEQLKRMSGSPIVAREIDHVLRLPFAGPSAFLDQQVDTPQFRASLVVGQAQHRAIAEAIELREGARAEALAREHARLARHNLEFLLNNRDGLPGIPALALVAG